MYSTRNILLLTTFAMLTVAVRADDLADDLRIVREAEAKRVAMMANVTPSIVCIFDEDRGGGGAGVIITEDGYGLTNAHVVANMLETSRGVGGLSDGKLYPLRVLGIDLTGDVAMFKLSGKDRFTPALIGNSDNVHVGDWVFAMGNPYLLADDYTPTVTHGIVSGVHRYQFGADSAKLVYTDCIQIDASINPGNSGGPLFDMDGHVIGINGRGSFEHRGRVNVGIGYAISINQIKRFVPGLRAGLLTEHGGLGAIVTDVGYRQVIFEKMLEPSAASAAGIQVGDRLVRFANQPIHSANEFANILGTYPADWPVTIEYERNGDTFRRLIRLERLPVKLEQPWEVDEETNRSETRRVLNAAQQRLGSRPADNVVRYSMGRATTTLTANQQLTNLWKFDVTEWPDGHGESYGVSQTTTQEKRYEYSTRSAQIRLANKELISAVPAMEDRLQLWLAAQQALYTTVNDETIKQWRHEGGDALSPHIDNASEARVGDVLLCQSPDFKDIIITFDPDTHWPTRVRYASVHNVRDDRPDVELVLHNFTTNDGLAWPSGIDVFVDGNLTWLEIFANVRLESAP